MPEQAPAPTRLDSLDALRGLAALGIVVLHVWMFDYGDAHRPEKGFLELAIGELRLGVPLFFVLSGFLLYRPFVASALDGRAPHQLRRYAIRRVARILPAYWLALLAGFFLLRHLDHPSQAMWSELPVHALFLQNYFVETLKDVDPPMWTLGVEVAFYATLPLFGWLGLRVARTRTRQALLCAALAVAGAVVAGVSMVQRWEPTVTNSLLTHTHEFAAGMLVAV
ncbi:MAG TPA: acyltransferase, partial [Solirubrobacteraceae bacterium]|nr:acyltransferase [Solirubrobacteraceae bacterium]